MCLFGKVEVDRVCTNSTSTGVSFVYVEVDRARGEHPKYRP